MSVHKDMERKHPLLVRALSEEDSGYSTFSTNSEYAKVKVIPQPLNLTRLEVEVNENGLNTTSKNVSLFHKQQLFQFCFVNELYITALFYLLHFNLQKLFT